MSIKALHLTAIPLRFIAAGELDRSTITIIKEVNYEEKNEKEQS